jgi:hypothetical protein
VSAEAFSPQSAAYIFQADLLAQSLPAVLSIDRNGEKLPAGFTAMGSPLTSTGFPFNAAILAAT